METNKRNTSFMKHLAAALFATLLCSCGFIKTNEVATGTGTPVPADRLLMKQTAEAGMAKLLIARDTGYLGGGCFIGVEIDRKLAARFDTGEVATFYVAPGKVELSVVGDPIGGGLCGIGFAAVRETYYLPADRLTRFRLSSRQYRRPELESNDVEAIDNDVKSPAPVAITQPVGTAPVPAAPVAPGQPSSAPPMPGAAQAPRAFDGAPVIAPQSPTLRSSAIKELKYQFSAETLAKTRQCAAHPIATLVASAPGAETYSIRCDAGDALIERCDFGNCRVLQ